ncbi:hypothetical protein VSDG_02930 [Cytospora chrysosperma]|uniref:Metallo-beta-lactamase domain-containing protein n=1 Tax=Cytospora chrysosperma TaxID=252740 RepID=A0A423W936_CYTCH|nr:hypothetical protein VSDG_02930 [Valsa sordida]
MIIIDKPCLPAAHTIADPSLFARSSNTRLYYLKPGVFWEPAFRGHDGFYMPVYCFLVSRGNRNVLFDLGSHIHFDYIGDPSRFPPATELIIGPGVKAAAWPGYPINPDGSVLDSAAAGRSVRKI